jgi:biotin transporter BioY
MRRALLLRASGVVTFIAATFGLWYGFAMSFLVPGIPGEPYFQRNRVLLGNVPLVASVLALCAAGWLIFRATSEPKITVEKTITYCVAGAAGLCFLFAVIGSAIYQR